MEVFTPNDIHRGRCSCLKMFTSKRLLRFLDGKSLSVSYNYLTSKTRSQPKLFGSSFPSIPQFSKPRLNMSSMAPIGVTVPKLLRESHFMTTFTFNSVSYLFWKPLSKPSSFQMIRELMINSYCRHLGCSLCSLQHHPLQSHCLYQNQA